MKTKQETIEDDIIEDITEETLLSLDQTLEADAESTEIAEAKVKEEEEDDEEEDADEMEEAMDGVGKEDEDVDNDGDSDETDAYLKNRRKKIAAAIEKQNEEVELEEGSMDITAIAKKLGLSDAEVNKLEMQSAKQYSKGKGQTMLVDILKSVDNMSGPFRKAGMHYAKTGQFGMLDMIVNDRDADMDENMKEEVDSSDITRLVESEVGLTEQFKEKATLIFETAVRTKVAETEALLKEEYATRLAEEVETIQEDLVEKIDSYLTYAVESWVADNKVAVESTLRTEIAENFITSLKSVFVENYIDVPEGKTDLVAQMEAELSESQEAAAKLERIAESLAEKVETLSRANVLAEASRDLADTQAARLQSLSEDVQYVDADSFRKKVETLKEFYINSRQNVEEETFEDSSYISKETIVENETFGETVSPSMQNYLTAISRLNNASSANLVG